MHYIYVVFLASLNTEKCPQFNLQFASTKVAFYIILLIIIITITIVEYV